MKFGDLCTVSVVRYYRQFEIPVHVRVNDSKECKYQYQYAPPIRQCCHGLVTVPATSEYGTMRWTILKNANINMLPPSDSVITG